jgi:hypothetical protein
VVAAESGTTPFDTVTVWAVGVPVQTPLVKKLYVTVPPAVAVEPLKVAVSWTAVPRLTELTVAPEESLIFVATEGLAKFMVRVKALLALPLWLVSLGEYVPVTLAEPDDVPVNVAVQSAVPTVVETIPVLLLTTVAVQTEP